MGDQRASESVYVCVCARTHTRRAHTNTKESARHGTWSAQSSQGRVTSPIRHTDVYTDTHRHTDGTTSAQSSQGRVTSPIRLPSDSL